MIRMSRRTWKRGLAVLAIGAAALAAEVPAAFALTYTSGDVLYVAYQSPSGPNYIVDLGPRTNFVNATTTITLPDVLASDLNGVIGASAPNIFVGLFGVLNPSTRDGIVSAYGPSNDTDLSTANALGAVSQIDSFGNGVVSFALAVPSGNVHGAKFASSGSTGSYQSTLDASNAGSLGNNVPWDVETALSNAAGARNPAAVQIPFYQAVRNPFTGTSSRAVIGFFTLSPNGTVTYSPDHDGDFIADDVDLCPGVTSGDNTDVDGDHHAPACDCNPTDGTVWSIPTEVGSLTFTGNTSFAWVAPSDPGGTAPLYDVLQAGEAGLGVALVYACFLSNQTLLTGSDPATPAVGHASLYLIRAGNSCGDGLAGTNSAGQPVTAPACP